MRATSDKAPIVNFAIQKVGTLADIRFFENVNEINENEETRYEYDVYLLTTGWTEGLENEIATNTNFWLTKAKESESKETVAVPAMEEMAVALLQTQLEVEIAQEALDFLIMGGF